MSRPRIEIGTWGEFDYQEAGKCGVRARAYFRDWDGSRRLVQATGATKAAAERALKSKLAKRADCRPTDTALTPDSTFAQLGEYWLADIKLEDRLAAGTRDRYAYHLRQLVLPAFKDLTLREIGVARCDTLIKQLAHKSYNRARQAKVVLRLAFSLAVRHEVIPRNPMDGIARLHKPPHSPDALTPTDVQAIRTAVGLWATGIVASGPKPDGQLSAIIEVMLGTSARIGEVLAIRRRDVDVTGVSSDGGDSWHDRHAARCDTVSSRSSEDGEITAYGGDSLVHGARAAGAVGEDGRPDSGRAGVLLQERHATDDEQRQAATKACAGHGRDRGCHPAQVPPHGGHGDQRVGRRGAGG